MRKETSTKWQDDEISQATEVVRSGIRCVLSMRGLPAGADAVDDVLQTAWVRILQARTGHIRSLKDYLFLTAKRVVEAYFRSADALRPGRTRPLQEWQEVDRKTPPIKPQGVWRQDAHGDATPQGRERDGWEEHREFLRDRLRRAPWAMRRVVALHLAGYTFTEIGQRLHIATTTAYDRYTKFVEEARQAAREAGFRVAEDSGTLVKMPA